jgi:ABC-type transport system involved in cytochrome c biogenesis permease component
MAQILPLLLVASVVENALSFERQRYSPGLFTAVMRTFGLGFLVAEGFALYAVASNSSSTFILLVPVIIAVMLTTDVITGALERAGAKEMKDPATRVEELMKSRVVNQRAKAAALEASADLLASELNPSRGSGDADDSRSDS